MSKKMKFPSLLNNNTEVKSCSSSWPWLSCHQPRTLSSRANNNLFLDATMEMHETSESFFTLSTDSTSFSTNISEDSILGQDSMETVIRESRSDRLFFEPDETSSILEAKSGIRVPFKGSVALTMDSQNPYVDFRKSIEEIVEAHCVKDLEGLEELFCWYLRVNEKSCHGYIVNAFVDLYFGLKFSSCCSCSIPCVDNITSSSLLLEQVKVIKPEDEGSTTSSSNV